MNKTNKIKVDCYLNYIDKSYVNIKCNLTNNNITKSEFIELYLDKECYFGNDLIRKIETKLIVLNYKKDSLVFDEDARWFATELACLLTQYARLRGKLK